jgi:hypothetical protein
MDSDLTDRIDAQRKRLQNRALELSHPGQNGDTATILMSLALIFETLAEIDHDLRRLTARLHRP